MLFSWQLQNSPHDFDFLMGADYSFEFISIVPVPQFIGNNNIFLGSALQCAYSLNLTTSFDFFLNAFIGEKGELVLTGQLGDVMKESANLALSWIRSNAKKVNNFS